MREIETYGCDSGSKLSILNSIDELCDGMRTQILSLVIDRLQGLEGIFVEISGIFGSPITVVRIFSG